MRPPMTFPAATYRGERIGDPIVSPARPLRGARVRARHLSVYTYDALP